VDTSSHPGRTGINRLTGFLPRVSRWLPWWASALIGIGAVVLGVLLIVRPLSSVTVLTIYIGLSCVAAGVASLSSDAARSRQLAAGVLGAGWIVLGVAVLAGLGRAIGLLPTVIAVALIVSGLVRGFEVRRAPTLDARIATGLFGLTDIVFGVVALAWPDITLLVVAVLFGARTIAFGLAQVWQAVRRGRDARHLDATGTGRAESAVATRWRRLGRTTAALAMVLVSVAALVVSGRLTSGSPAVDDFYEAPDQVPSEPGRLLRSEPFTREVPDGARAWRILYTTTRDDDTPALASAIVLVPESGSSHPVIAWAHGTTGYTPNCAPSVLDEPFTSGALLFPDEVVEEGWALVATDYIGMGTEGPQPYLVGQGEGRSVLDAVRAARELTEASLGDQTVVWGHSQGGHAALWTGQIQPSYAPDVPLLGVAAMAPAANLIGLTGHLADLTGGSVLASLVAQAYVDAYPDVTMEQYVIASARPLVREMAMRCWSEPGMSVSVLDALSISGDRPIFASDPLSGPLGDRLRENTPAGGIDVPLLLAQGESDPLIAIDLQDEFVESLCSAGQQVDYRTYPGLDHMGLVGRDSPLVTQLFEWTRSRLSGDPEITNTCDA